MNVIPVQPPSGLAEIIAYYGDPKIKITNGVWTVDKQWEAANLITIHHGLLPFGKLYVHKLIAQPTLNVLDRWSARIQAGDMYSVRKIGCFSPRAQRGSSGLIASTHTWAIAWDLNPDQNPMFSLDDPRRLDPASHDIPDTWVADAQAEGFFWGGNFHNRADFMHFQLAVGY